MNLPSDKKLGEPRSDVGVAQNLLASTQREVARAIGASFEAFQQQMAASIEQLQNVLDRLSEQLRPLTASLTLSLTLLLKEEKRIEEAFRAGGMLAAPSMSLKLVDTVVTLHEVGNDADIAKVIVEHYRASRWRRLKKMVKTWERDGTYVEERIHIIKEALCCHCRGWFHASVPTLLSQVEGISSDFAFDAKRYDKLGHPKAVTTEALESAPMGLTTLALAIAAFSRVNEFLGNIYSYRNFADVYEESRHSPQLWGQAVRHGISIGYASETNSLTLFLLLDSFSLLGRWMHDSLEEEDIS